MADSFELATVTAALAALGPSITVTKADGTTGAIDIRDIGAIPSAVNQADCPVLAPNPDNFITNLKPERVSFGGDAARKNWTYNLNYVFYYAPALQGPDLFAAYGDMVNAAVTLLLYLATHTATIPGCQEILPLGVPQFGKQTDVGGTNFHGCKISFSILQFMEA